MKNRLLLLLSSCMLLAGFASAQTWTCGDTLTDIRDNKQYGTVQIGSACWMKENLDYGQFATSITSSSTHADVTNNGIAEKYCQDNDSANCAIYGGLYDWNEMMNYNPNNAQGICPNGWHVSTDAEWLAMIAASGGSISGFAGTGGNALKAVGEGFGPNGQGTNTSGFTARAGGDRDGFGIFYGMGLRFIFWTSTPDTTKKMYMLYADDDTINRFGNAQTITGFSCRCVQDVISSGMRDGNGYDKLVSVFPNPAQNRVSINIDRLFVSADYSIYNATGQRVQSGGVNNPREVISVSQLAGGSYMLVVRIDDTIIRKPLLISGR